VASYVDLTTVFKPYIKMNAAVSVLEDAVLQMGIDAAEAGINIGLARTITLVPADAPSARLYTPAPCGTRIDIDDAATITAVGGVAFDAELFRCTPLQHRDPSGQWRPYDTIETRSGWTVDSWGDVSVTGTWGWTVIPPNVTEACKVLAKDVLANRDVAFGMHAFTEYAAQRVRTNPVVWELIGDLRGIKSFGVA